CRRSHQRGKRKTRQEWAQLRSEGNDKVRDVPRRGWKMEHNTALPAPSRDNLEVPSKLRQR
ncbi:TPA: hypothetical protein N0F65_003938, partial [Lagenidium giganteum]